MALGRIFAVSITCVACMLTPFALAQQTAAPETQTTVQTGSIAGTILNVLDSPVPAAITLTGPGIRRAAVAGVSGFFAFQGLPPGAYRLTVSAEGFASWASPVLILQPGEQRELGAIHLNLAVVQTTVTVLTDKQIATREVHLEEQQRVLGVFPNFYVVYTPHPVPLTSKLKYELALRASIDPVNILGTAAFAGFNQAADTPDYREGAIGYAQRFGAAYTDGFTDIMIGGAILPSLLHQDPRYFYQGTGSVASRIRHALAFTILCKGDNGHWQFNYSSVGGDLASGALSNLYYPPSNRGVGTVFVNAALSAAGRAASDLAQEFVFKRFTHRGKPKPLKAKQPAGRSP